MSQEILVCAQAWSMRWITLFDCSSSWLAQICAHKPIKIHLLTQDPPIRKMKSLKAILEYLATSAHLIWRTCGRRSSFGEYQRVRARISNSKSANLVLLADADTSWITCSSNRWFPTLKSERKTVLGQLLVLCTNELNVTTKNTRTCHPNKKCLAN